MLLLTWSLQCHLVMINAPPPPREPHGVLCNHRSIIQENCDLFCPSVVFLKLLTALQHAMSILLSVYLQSFMGELMPCSVQRICALESSNFTEIFLQE